ncbi:MAG: class I SAM-dependent methyltransferase [Dehalococcoidia bacterium]|nr:class I SAM-dependent methyltransferase [Dehalococcoidia bacterium]
MRGDEATSLTQKRYDRQAGLFDFWEAPIEALGFKRLRKRLWSEVHGERILEVGVGTGKNLPYHPQGSRSVAVDLSPRMLSHAARKAGRLGRDVDLVLADAQRLPFRDGAFDAAAATFVFCSVPDPVLGLREVRRVVRQDGGLHLLEHVRSRNPIVGRLMDWTNPLWVRVSGANINRDTVDNVQRAGFELDAVESRMFGILKLIRGKVLQTVGANPEAVSDVALG